MLGGRGYTTTSALANAGTLQLGGGIFTAVSLTCAAGSKLTGFGKVAKTFLDSGSVTASGGALVFTGIGDTFTGKMAGTEIDFAGGTDTLQLGTSLTASAVNISGGASVMLSGDLTYAGALTEGAGSVAIGNNTLVLKGPAALRGTVSGDGKLVVSGGSQTIGAGAAITTGFESFRFDGIAERASSSPMLELSLTAPLP